MENSSPPKPRINPDIWFYAFVFVVLGIIGVALYTQHQKALRAKDYTISQLTRDTTRLYNRAIENGGRADRLTAQRATEQAAYARSLSTLQADKQRIVAWAQSLSTERQIGAIAKTLPVELQGDSSRIQKAYTAKDKDLIRQLYQVVEERNLYRARFDTATRQNVALDADNARLRSREIAYRRTLENVRTGLLTEAETRRFLGVGRRDAMKQLAQTVTEQISDLERELNGGQ